MPRKVSIFLQLLCLLLIVCLTVFLTVFIYAGLIDYLEGPLRDELTLLDYTKFSASFAVLGIITVRYISSYAGINSAAVIAFFFILASVVLILFYPWHYGYTPLLPHMLVAICICLTVIFFAFNKSLRRQ